MPKETISQKLKNFGHRFKDLPNHIRKSKIVTSKNYSSEVLETISAVGKLDLN